MKRLVAWAETRDQDVLLTPWSLVHFTVGGAARKLDFNFWVYEALHALYEAKDNLMMRNKPHLVNSLTNSLGDQAITTLGWYLAKHGSKHFWVGSSVASFVLMIGLGDRVG